MTTGGVGDTVGVADRPSVAKELGGGLTSKGTADEEAGVEAPPPRLDCRPVTP